METFDLTRKTINLLREERIKFERRTSEIILRILNKQENLYIIKTNKISKEGRVTELNKVVKLLVKRSGTKNNCTQCPLEYLMCLWTYGTNSILSSPVSELKNFPCSFTIIKSIEYDIEDPEPIFEEELNY